MTCELLIEESAWCTAKTAGSRNLGRETGGVLLGWRHDNGIYVSAVLEVKDPRARHAFYRRRHAPAEQTLNRALAKLPPDSPVGYVGEWHTHPSPQGPSWVDRREIRRISKRSDHPVGLLVCAYAPQHGQWHSFGLCAANGRVQHAEVRIHGGSE